MFKNPEKVIDAFEPKGVDVLILAGDILSLKYYSEAKAIFEKFCKLYPQVLYVPGNHDLWHTSFKESMLTCASLDDSIPNFTVLEAGKVVTIRGQRFLGDAMWFKQTTVTEHYGSNWPDFAYIHSKLDIYNQNTEFRKFLEKELKEGDIVITHHLPSPNSVAKRFKKDLTNEYFLCDQSDLIKERKPKLWIHGHTHDAFDYTQDSTRIVCNPQDYPGRRMLSMVNHKKIDIETPNKING